jgi:hypothetical protein
MAEANGHHRPRPCETYSTRCRHCADRRAAEAFIARVRSARDAHFAWARALESEPWRPVRAALTPRQRALVQSGAGVMAETSITPGAGSLVSAQRAKTRRAGGSRSCRGRRRSADAQRRRDGVMRADDHGARAETVSTGALALSTSSARPARATDRYKGR